MNCGLPPLILHSVDDEYVPYGPSASLAEKNPEMVTFEPFNGARHTKEWNVDPERWERLVRAWLRQQLAPRDNPGQARRRRDAAWLSSPDCAGRVGSSAGPRCVEVSLRACRRCRSAR